uniref:Crumbs homolog 3b n=1 Tax=Sphaeramia orbicularis TaxID=375764 RepID=A0A672ZRJ0_9TELE
FLIFLYCLANCFLIHLIKVCKIYGVTMVMQVTFPPAAPALVCAVLSLLSLALLLLLCVIRKKRRMEGTYRPSAEEKKQTRAGGPEKPGLPLPLPKEERLI